MTQANDAFMKELATAFVKFVQAANDIRGIDLADYIPAELAAAKEQLRIARDRGLIDPKDAWGIE